MATYDSGEIRQADNAYIRKTMRKPLLDRDHEVNLAKRWRDHDDDQAMHELVMAYARLVVSAASKYRHYGLANGDLIQEGNIGLMQAAKRFDPNRGFAFPLMLLGGSGPLSRIIFCGIGPLCALERLLRTNPYFLKLRRLRARIGEADGGPLSEEGRQKIAESIGVTVTDVVTMEQRLSGADMSLNSYVNTESENEAQDFLADERPSPEQVVIELHDKKVLSRWLSEALNELSARERLIILKRRLNEEGATLEQLGRILGVSKERVRQLEHRALKKLQKTLEIQSRSSFDESSLDLLSQFS